MKRLIVDVPNLFWRTVSSHNGKYTGTADDKAGLALHSCLVTLNKWYKQIKPDQIAVVFEGSKNWRKTYTASPECISKIGYKANRVKDPSMAHLYEVLTDFENLVRANSSIICLQNDLVEGDDLIAGFVQKYVGDEVVILSGDKDFCQLLKHKNVTLLNPEKGIPRTVEDPEYFMFEKCFRGDNGDNVRSAYPNVRATRLKKAFVDEYELYKIMNETWSKFDPSTDTEIVYSVGKLFEENNILMNLEAQPEHIRTVIESAIEEGLSSHGKFSMFAFNKFLGKHELKALAQNPDVFIPLFSCTQLNKHKETSSVIQF
jgi:hypothetical protein